MPLKQRKQSIPRLPLDRLDHHDEKITEQDFGEVTRRTVKAGDWQSLNAWIGQLYRYKRELASDAHYPQIREIAEALGFPQDVHTLEVYAHFIYCLRSSLTAEKQRFLYLRCEVTDAVREFDEYQMASFYQTFSIGCADYVHLLYQLVSRARDSKHSMYREIEYKYSALQKQTEDCILENRYAVRRMDVHCLAPTDQDVALLTRTKSVVRYLQRARAIILAYYESY